MTKNIKQEIYTHLHVSNHGKASLWISLEDYWHCNELMNFMVYNFMV